MFSFFILRNFLSSAILDDFCGVPSVIMNRRPIGGPSRCVVPPNSSHSRTAKYVSQPMTAPISIVRSSHSPFLVLTFISGENALPPTRSVFSYIT